MRFIRNIALLLFVMFFYACNGAERNNVSVEGVDLIIDVRTSQEYNAGHLKDAINIPHDQVGHLVGSFAKDKNAKIMVYCRSGRRSGIALETLNNMGYSNVINAGAYEKLKKAESD